MRVLRVIASQGRRGMAFTAIAAGSGLPQGTVHRLLASLSAEGLVHRDLSNRKYYLGHLLYEFGLVAMPLFRFIAPCQDALKRLAALTGDTVYLSERIGDEAVTASRLEGTFPLKTLTLHVGMRRPLGVGAGGLAILASLPPEDAAQIVHANALYLPALANFDAQFLLGAISEARVNGFAYLDSRATRGMAAVGVALHDPLSGAQAAISVAAVPSRMTLERAARVAEAIRKEAGTIERAMTQSSSVSAN